jgi:hypothetical protein
VLPQELSPHSCACSGVADRAGVDLAIRGPCRRRPVGNLDVREMAVLRTGHTPGQRGFRSRRRAPKRTSRHRSLVAGPRGLAGVPALSLVPGPLVGVLLLLTGGTAVELANAFSSFVFTITVPIFGYRANARLPAISRSRAVALRFWSRNRSRVNDDHAGIRREEPGDLRPAGTRDVEVRAQWPSWSWPSTRAASVLHLPSASPCEDATDFRLSHASLGRSLRPTGPIGRLRRSGGP